MCSIATDFFQGSGDLWLVLVYHLRRTMILALVLFAVASSARSQILDPNIRNYRINPYYDESPKPYSFSYNAPLEDGVGQSSRTETADGSGRVQGSYSLTNEEGHTRVVDYIADQDGFRATIRTNEPGTDNKNPADVIIESTGPYSDRPFQYAPGLRRPVLNVGAEPVPVPVEPVNVVPVVNPVQPVIRPGYRRPTGYNRNNLYRPGYRSPYNRNAPY